MLALFAAGDQKTRRAAGSSPPGTLRLGTTRERRPVHCVRVDGRGGTADKDPQSDTTRRRRWSGRIVSWSLGVGMRREWYIRVVHRAQRRHETRSRCEHGSLGGGRSGTLGSRIDAAAADGGARRRRRARCVVPAVVRADVRGSRGEYKREGAGGVATVILPRHISAVSLSLASSSTGTCCTWPQ